MQTQNANVSSRGSIKPKARNEEIVIQELKNEMLVYDLENDKAHHLNETVAFVWKICDGKTSTKEIASQLSSKFKTEIEEDFVMLAFDELEKANLLNQNPAGELVDLARRKVVFKYATVAAALPIVMSLVAPPPALAQSCAAQGQPCAVDADCCDTPLGLKFCNITVCSFE